MTRAFRPSPSLLIALAATSLGALAQADVKIVAADGSAPFLTIQDAVDAALDKDVVLVRPGTYAGFEIDDEGLTVTAEIGTRVTVNSSVRVRDLAQGRTVLLSNLDVTGSFNAPPAIGHGLRLENNLGAVRAQNCTFSAWPSNIPAGLEQSGREGASLEMNADVMFTRCEFLGGHGRDFYDCCGPGHPGGHGIENVASVLALYDCHVEGFEGGYSGWGGLGGHGLVQNGPALYAAGCTLVGGKGGYGDDFVFGPGGDGGDGLRALAGSSSVLVDTALAGGDPGESFLGSPGASAGAPSSGPGSLSTSPGPARHLSTTNIGWAGAQVGLELVGQPGDRVRLVASPGTDATYRPNVEGVWALELPAELEPQTVGSGSHLVVTLPASGKLTVGVDVLSLGTGGSNGSWYAQGYVISAGGTRHLTAPVMLARLQCAYSADCDGNGQPDGCDVASGASPDCNLNGIPDLCDFGGGEALDCNANGVPDVCDLSTGSSLDCNLDEVPDECQVDCNANGVPDDCDVLGGTSADCDGNLVPDECSIDCNTNGVPDLCDISGGTSLDLDANGVPDECQSASDTYYVDAASVPWGDGSVSLPFDTIGQAVDYAIAGNTILVLDGTYTGAGNRDVSFGGRDLVVRSQNGPAACVIDLESAGRAFHLTGGETQAARIEGFTIRNGHSDPGTPGGGAGSSILVESASPTIEGCIIRDSVSSAASLQGGGAVRFSGPMAAGAAGARVRSCSFLDNSSFRGAGLAGHHTSGTLLVEDCYFSGNEAESGAAMYLGGIGVETILRGVDVRGNHSSYGGAIFQHGGELVITQSIVAENTGGFGAGIYISHGDSLHLTHTIIAANHASPSQGGGLALLDFNDSMDVRIDNCLVFANTAASIGGGMVLRDANDMRITNCSFFLNQGTRGGAMYVEGSGTHRVRNCLMWENSASQSGAQMEITSTTTDVDYCNLQGGQSGISTSFGGALVYGSHNSSVYPGFVDPDGADDDLSTWEDNDVRLGPTSAARDAGDNTALEMDLFDLDGDGNTTEPVPIDLGGVPRLVDSNQPDTGNGAAPIVDLGCYEDQ